MAIGTIISNLPDAGILQQGTDLILIARPSVADFKITVSEFIAQVVPGSGTVNSVSIASANGFAGSSSGGASPILTISTSISGILKGNGTAISPASVGVDYSAGTSGLSTGILKSTTGTGVLSIASPSDFPTLNQNTTGNAATATLASTATTAALASTVTTNANLTGDVTSVGNSTTLSTVNSNVGAFTNANITVDAKGRITAAANGAGGGGGTITLTGNVTGSGTSSIATTIGAGSVTNAMLAGSITASNLVGTDIATVGTITSGTWNGTILDIAHGGTGQATAANALNALLPSQTGNGGKFLTTSGSVPSWATTSGGGGGTALTWINVQSNGVLPTNSGATNSANFQALVNAAAGSNTVVWYFPAGNYNFASTINLNAVISWTIIGDCVTQGSSSSGTTLFANFSGTLLDVSTIADKTYAVRNIQITNKHVSGICMDSQNGEECIFERVIIYGGQGQTYSDYHNTTNIGLRMQNFSTCYVDLVLRNHGVGLMVGSGGGGEACHTVDAESCSEGIRAQGSGLSLFGYRCEVSGIAANLGVDFTGAKSFLNCTVISGVSLEANTVGIACINVSTSVINGVQCLLHVNSFSGNAQYGLYLGTGSRSLTIMASAFAGAGSCAMIGAPSNFSASGAITFIGVTTGQGLPGGKRWDVPTNMDVLTFINCDNTNRDTATYVPNLNIGTITSNSIQQRNLLLPCVEGSNMRSINYPVPVGATSVVVPFNPLFGSGSSEVTVTQTTGGALNLLGTYLVCATTLTPHGECTSPSIHTVVLTGSNNAISCQPSGSTAGLWLRRYYISDGSTDWFGNVIWNGCFEGLWNDDSAFLITTSVLNGTVTNTSNTTPIQMTCASPHELINGNVVTIVGSSDSHANVTGVVTVVDSLNFTVAGTTANGGSSGGIGTWTLKGGNFASPPPVGTNQTGATEPDGNYAAVATGSWAGNGAAVQQNCKMTTGVTVLFNSAAVAPVITGSIATASNASPIKITTSGVHSLQTGQTVTVAGCSDTNANTTALVTVLDGLNFTLTGTTADGGGTGGTWTLQNAISGTTGVNGGAITVTTTNNHGLASEQSVIIAGVGGMTQANGTWKIQVLSANTFVIVTAKAGSSAYTSGGTWAPAATVDLKITR